MKYLPIVTAAALLASTGLVVTTARGEEGVTLDRAVARGFAAMIVEVIPENTAWAAATDGSLSIMDDTGKVILQGAIPVGAWDGAMALLNSRNPELLGRIINGAPLLGGDNTWPTTYFKGAVTPVMFGWEERVGALWQERLQKLAVADTDGADGDPVKQMEAWFGRQYSKDGQYCCSKSDAYPFDGPYNLTVDGGVTFQWLDHDGNQFTVAVPPGRIVQPKTAMVGDREVVVDGNPTGGAVIWYTGTLNEGFNVNLYCFEPGPLN